MCDGILRYLINYALYKEVITRALIIVYSTWWLEVLENLRALCTVNCIFILKESNLWLELYSLARLLSEKFLNSVKYFRRTYPADFVLYKFYAICGSNYLSSEFRWTVFDYLIEKFTKIEQLVRKRN